MRGSQTLGTEPIGKLLFKQSLPAAIGFMVMSLNSVVDTIYLGKFIGDDAIGAVTAVTAIIFLFAVLGMAIGMGGASIVSRALGAGDKEKASWALNNQISMVLICFIAIVTLGYSFSDSLVWLFGAKGDIFPLGLDYFKIVLVGIPFLAWGMMCNNNIRAEGRATMAMMILLVPSIVNIVLDDVLIRQLGGGIESAAWATTISFMLSSVFTFYFYFFGNSELKFSWAQMRLKKELVKEIAALGSVSLIRQGSISLLMIILGWSLHKYGAQDIPAPNGGEMAYSSYGVASRLAMFVFFPLIGISQGFMPITGYNYGAKQYVRVRKAITLSVVFGTIIAAFLCAILLFGANYIPSLFSVGPEMTTYASDAIFYVFLATPLVMFPFIGSSYYQAIGKPLPAMLLTLTKQTFCLVPIIYILPIFYGLKGVWYSFPIADSLAAIICLYYLLRAIKRLK